ncbi:MAG: protein kinase [Nocardioides sp.]
MISGRYSLDREIGRGGMGAVWLGRDEVLGRQVAIKRIGMLPGGLPPDLERAEREARIAARLNHPHVVAVFDLVHEDDQQWLVMEYVDGQTLAQLVSDRGALTPDAAAPLLAQAAEALAAAHEAGIVHRDVKPSNMLVTEAGQVKISDFGIARAEADASLTQTGLVTGSPAYLAPEVATGQQATGASDAWSLGATLFHALSGRPPYDVSDNVLGALYRIVHEEPPRLEEAGWLAPLLEATMTKDPDDRWSMTEISEFLKGGPSRASARAPVSPPAAADSESTQVMPQPVSSVSSVPTVRRPMPSPPTAPARAAPKRRGRPPSMAPFLVAAAVLAVVVAVVLAGTFAGPDSRDPTANDSSDDPSTSSEPSASKSPPAAPTAKGMETFIADYLATASSDSAAGFEQLTPDFQAASGGLEGYSGFWDEVSNVRVQSVAADPDDLTVSYNYDYSVRGAGTQNEDVSLRLTYKEGTYLIAGED